MLNDKRYRAILCLNGDLPDKAFFARDLPVIAADGAANKLAAMKIKPDMIIGDMDSVDHAHLEATPHLLDPDQSASDFQKSLHYLQQNNLLPSIIVGVNGGHLDHILNNVNLMLQTDSMIYAPPVIGITIKGGEKKLLSLSTGTKISLLGLPQALVTSNGLKWELTSHQLAFPGNTSCFNRAHRDNVEIEVHDGNVLALIYQHDMPDAGW